MIADFFSAPPPGSPVDSHISHHSSSSDGFLQKELEAQFSSSNQMPARLVFVGDGRVGSSALIRRFTANKFDEGYRPERAKVMRHTKTMYSNKLEIDVTVQFWDIEGGDFQTGLFCAAKAHAVAVLYDITNRTSFERAQMLLDGINPRASVLLIGTKVDLERDLRKVSQREGRLLAKIHRVHFLEVSAKTDYCVEEVFKIMLASVPEEYLRSKDGGNADRRWHVSTAAVLCAVCSRKVRTQSRDKDRERTDSNRSSDSQQSGHSNSSHHSRSSRYSNGSHRSNSSHRSSSSHRSNRAIEEAREREEAKQRALQAAQEKQQTRQSKRSIVI